MMLVLPLAMVALVAFANGANDNFKGVASLWGSRAVGYSWALGWATATTLAGSLASLLLATTLAARFSGKGLVPDALVGQTAFLTAVGMAAALTVVVATRIGFPVSTTHALLGGLLGAGIASAGIAALRLQALERVFLLPLLLSPILSGVLAALVYVPMRTLRRQSAIEEDACVCVGAPETALAAGGGVSLQGVSLPTLQVGNASECAASGMPESGTIRVASLMDALHLAGSGCVGFVRGMNDTPKIAALLVAVPALRGGPGIALVAGIMAVGGLLGARRVANTLSWKITGMNAGQATVASLVTALLVGAASFAGLPVSTTHVSCGALFGIGSVSGPAKWHTIRSIAIAWCLTLPVAAVLGYAAATVLR